MDNRDLQRKVFMVGSKPGKNSEIDVKETKFYQIKKVQIQLNDNDYQVF